MPGVALTMRDRVLSGEAEVPGTWTTDAKIGYAFGEIDDNLVKQLVGHLRERRFKHRRRLKWLVAEKQFIVNHLQKHVARFSNMGRTNSLCYTVQKGAVTELALQGKAIKKKKLRNRYMVDKVYAKHHITTTRTAEEYLRRKFVNAGPLKGKMVEPTASIGNSPQVSPGTKGKGKHKANSSGSPTPKRRSAGKKAFGLKTTSQRGRAGGASSSSSSG
ncbi:hypothetical protein BKA70DRAFT_1398883 [Coprinopsis sp. MPI-PUGE-AT-0042]|nr:hypothetical protein BKA70DRAFT_1398883 [Coprinopsis sp. MPI-PUGE-AT-0042]